MKRLRLLSVAAAAIGTMAVAPAASAQSLENCVGTQETIFVCVDPTGGTLYSDCVYTGGDTCQPVTVPGPVVTQCDGDDDPKELFTIIKTVVCNAIG